MSCQTKSQPPIPGEIQNKNEVNFLLFTIKKIANLFGNVKGNKSKTFWISIYVFSSWRIVKGRQKKSSWIRMTNDFVCERGTTLRSNSEGIQSILSVHFICQVMCVALRCDADAHCAQQKKCVLSYRKVERTKDFHALHSLLILRIWTVNTKRKNWTEQQMKILSLLTLLCHHHDVIRLSVFTNDFLGMGLLGDTRKVVLFCCCSLSLIERVTKSIYFLISLIFLWINCNVLLKDVEESWF